jgi:hypothetical protein
MFHFACSVSISGTSFVTLDGSSWVASSSEGGDSVQAVVPGDIVSALSAQGRIPESPWLDLTWREQAGLWDLQTWTFTRTFASPAATGSATLLVFDSIKMAANITLNGVFLGEAVNQHVRYTYSVQGILLPPGEENSLQVTFPPTVADARNDNGRYMAASGGWDWAAYSNETVGRTPKGIRTFSKGIVGSVYLVGAGAAFIASVKPLVFYAGAYPTAPLTPSAAGPWVVNITAYLVAATPSAVAGVLTLSVEWDPAHPVQVPVAIGEGAVGREVQATASLAVPPGAVALWWPADVLAGGENTLYAVSAAFASTSPVVESVATLQPPRVGFRALALVTADDTSPAALQGVEGSGNFTMRLRVNGANIFARGANWIPLEGLEARNSGSAQRRAVASAVGANMNMLRVWGGGVWPSDDLLSACDAAGVLLYIDAQYASQADSHHFPDPQDPTQAMELQQNIRRLASHPCISILDSGNECHGGGDFATFVAPLMAEEDPSHPLWPASPSSGWAKGVDRLWGLPLPGGSAPLDVYYSPSALPPSPVPGCPGCLAQGFAFVYGFPLSPFLAPLPVRDAAACCTLCASTPRCALANYESGGCQLVEPPLAMAPRGDAGSMVLYPPNSTLEPLGVPLDNFREQHGPYVGGGGWPTCNGHGSPPSPYDASLPPSLARATGGGASKGSGAGAPGQFTSEFGVGQIASFEIMAPTLSPTFWGMHGGSHPADACTAGFAHVCSGGNAMAQRNYACDDAWATYYPNASRMTVGIGGSGAESFSAQLYLCQLATALKLKGLVEFHRSLNLFGLLTWQLTEMWPTYGWGSLEYSSGEGSVTGGRWKPSHYFLRDAYASVFAACGAGGNCYVRNDNALEPLSATLTLTLRGTKSGAPVAVLLDSAPVDLPPGASALHFLCATGSGSTGSSSSSSSSINCTFTPGMDIQGTTGSSAPSADSAACCALCAAAPHCAAGVQAGGTCWLKDPGGNPAPKAGVTLCTPPGQPLPCTPLSAVLLRAGCRGDGSDCFLASEVRTAGGTTLANNVQLLGVPGGLDVARGVQVALTVGQGADGSVPITLTATGGAAFYATLFTLANGRFSENALLLLPGQPLVVEFLPFSEGQEEVLRDTVRVDHLGAFLKPEN